MEHILKENGKKERFEREVASLLKALSLAVPHDRAMEIKEEVGLFQAIKSAITKSTETEKKGQEERFDTAIKQILSRAVISDRAMTFLKPRHTKAGTFCIIRGLSRRNERNASKELSFRNPKKTTERRD